MYGISSSSKDQIHGIVSNLFDKVALRLVGPIPKLRHKKHTLLGFEEGPTLAALFILAMGNKWLNGIEEDVLKGTLEGANNYIDVLKNKTSNNISNKIDALAREARISGEKILDSEINKIMEEELSKAKSGLEAIAMAEGTKTRNLGAVMDITRIASQDGEKDPVVGFAGSNDATTCKECRRLFFMSDGVTPRLWRLSECGAGYFKRGDSVPSLLGLHPHCTHTPFMVPSDWGFDKSGRIIFIGAGHSEIKKQREKD